jgi:hypothetical protein
VRLNLPMPIRSLGDAPSTPQILTSVARSGSRAI